MNASVLIYIYRCGDFSGDDLLVSSATIELPAVDDAIVMQLAHERLSAYLRDRDPRPGRYLASVVENGQQVDPYGSLALATEEALWPHPGAALRIA